MSDYQANLKTAEATLKEFYLPAWSYQLGIEPSALLSKIKKETCTNDKIVAAAPMGLSGGFGFSEEGAATPAAGNVKFNKFETRTKDMYVNVTISQKAVSLASNKGAMIDSLDAEMKGAYDTAKWNVGRALFGNGTGILATLTEAVAPAGNTCKVNDTSKLKEGLIVDFYSSADNLAEKMLRIEAIDRINKTVTFNRNFEGPEGGFLTVQGSYKREITGLGAIFDNSIETIYGLSKAANPLLVPTTIYTGDDTIDDGFFTKGLRESQRDHNGNVDMILCGDEMFDDYVEYLRSDNKRVEAMSHTLKGGFTAIKFLFGNREVDIVNEGFVPSKEAWGVDTSALTLHSTDWRWSEFQGGGIFNLMEGQSVYRALLYNYGDLICSNPGGCMRVVKGHKA